MRSPHVPGPVACPAPQRSSNDCTSILPESRRATKVLPVVVGQASTRHPDNNLVWAGSADRIETLAPSAPGHRNPMNDQAIAALREALRVSPDNLPLRRHLAETLMGLARYAE